MCIWSHFHIKFFTPLHVWMKPLHTSERCWYNYCLQWVAYPQAFNFISWIIIGFGEHVKIRKKKNKPTYRSGHLWALNLWSELFNALILMINLKMWSFFIPLTLRKFEENVKAQQQLDPISFTYHLLREIVDWFSGCPFLSIFNKLSLILCSASSSISPSLLIIEPSYQK